MNELPQKELYIGKGSTQTQQDTPEINQRIPYRPITVQTLGDILHKYHDLSTFEQACKLMLDEELLILQKDTQMVSLSEDNAG